MNRKEVLHDFLFTDIAWVWHFNGFDKALRKQVMYSFWDYYRGNYEIKK